jgi:hypothetical protein
MGPTAHADTSTVFGMDLHKPFGVPECRYTRLGKTSGYYIQSLDSVCYELINENDPNAGKHAPISYDTVKIDWPIALKPQLVGGPGFALAKIMDGNLEGVSFNTMGIQSQERDLQLLIDKFGEPTVKNQQTVQNGYGAKFSAVRVSWEIDDLVVSYDSAPGSINSGLVHIESVRAAADRKAQMDKLTHGGQSL